NRQQQELALPSGGPVPDDLAGSEPPDPSAPPPITPISSGPTPVPSRNDDLGDPFAALGGPPPDVAPTPAPVPAAPPPAPAAPPQTWVEVDLTPPMVQLEAPKVGAGASAGKVTISWRATDPHLAARPIVLSYRPDRPDAIWQQITPPLENTGHYVWTV